MASRELINEWNSPMEDGRSIQPPLNEVQVDALAAEGVTPNTLIVFKANKTYMDIARVALTLCPHIMLRDRPQETAILLRDAHLNAFRQ